MRENINLSWTNFMNFRKACSQKSNFIVFSTNVDMKKQTNALPSYASL